MSETEAAIILANRILDEPYRDPDDTESMLARQFLRATERAERAEKDLALWRPLTDQEAEAALEAAEAVPMSDDEIAAIVKRATDPAERVSNTEQAQLAAKVAALTAAVADARREALCEAAKVASQPVDDQRECKACKAGRVIVAAIRQLI